MEKLPTVSNKSMFFDVAMFEHCQRVSKVFAASSMVPDHFQGNVSNCMIAMNYAARLNMDIFMVMQSLYVVHGRPGIESKLMIAIFNTNPKYTGLKFKTSGEGQKKNCIAYTKESKTGEIIEGPPVSMEMARLEGWVDKKGSKWKTLPDLMLRYRAAAFFIRLYSPESILGLQTKEELLDTTDYIDITPEKSDNIVDEIKEKATVKPEKDVQEELGENVNSEELENPEPPKTYEWIKKNDADGFLAAIEECGFSKEPEGDVSKAKVVECYDFMN